MTRSDYLGVQDNSYICYSMDNLSRLCYFRAVGISIDSQIWDYQIGIIQTVSTTFRHFVFQMYPELTIVFNPTVSELSKAITSLVGEDIIKHAYVIVLDSLVTDGFFGGDDSNNRFYIYQKYSDI